MHIRLINSADPNCKTCKVRSVPFHVTGSSNSTSSTTASTMHKDLGLKIGLGIGLGLPLLIALTIIATWACLRHRWQERQDPAIQSISAYRATMKDEKPLPPAPESSSQSKSTTATSPISSSSADQAVNVGEQYRTPVLDQAVNVGEQNRTPILELQPELMRVEAPRDTERVELDANPSRGYRAKWI